MLSMMEKNLTDEEKELLADQILRFEDPNYLSLDETIKKKRRRIFWESQDKDERYDRYTKGKPHPAMTTPLPSSFDRF
jgi:hypothetical protein